jgi:hypothetical protein
VVEDFARPCENQDQAIENSQNAPRNRRITGGGRRRKAAESGKRIDAATMT